MDTNFSSLNVKAKFTEMKITKASIRNNIIFFSKFERI